MPRAVSQNTTVAPAVQSPDHERARMIAAMRSMRRLLGDAIETLLIACDELDGEPDIEQDDSGFADQDALDLDQRGEPSLGAAENHPSSHVQLDYWGQRSAFGYTDQGSQVDWASGNRDEREGDEHDGAEPDESGIGDQDALILDQHGEPSLGWTNDMNQTRAMRGSLVPWSVEDGEAGDDNGIADAGGLNFDAEENGDAEMDWEGEADADLEYDYRDAPTTREQVVYVGVLTPEGLKPFGREGGENGL